LRRGPDRALLVAMFGTLLFITSERSGFAEAASSSSLTSAVEPLRTQRDRLSRDSLPLFGFGGAPSPRDPSRTTFLAIGDVIRRNSCRVSADSDPRALKNIREPLVIEGRGRRVRPRTSAVRTRRRPGTGADPAAFCVDPRPVVQGQPVWFNHVSDLTKPFLSFSTCATRSPRSIAATAAVSAAPAPGAAERRT
jgi:hypothetical protein